MIHYLIIILLYWYTPLLFITLWIATHFSNLWCCELWTVETLVSSARVRKHSAKPSIVHSIVSFSERSLSAFLMTSLILFLMRIGFLKIIGVEPVCTVVPVGIGLSACKMGVIVRYTRVTSPLQLNEKNPVVYYFSLLPALCNSCRPIPLNPILKALPPQNGSFY